MKQIIFFIGLLGLTQSFNNHKSGNTPSKDQCQVVLDSAKVLIETGDFSINWKVNEIDKERQFRISKWFEVRSYADLSCLLKSNNKLHQFYGYMYAAMFHKDSLKNNYADILQDTTSVQYNSENGLVDIKMTLGKLLQGMSKQLAKDQENGNKRPEIESRVSSFIKSYSSYPETYKPISFPYFSMGSDNTGLTNFNIRHEYQIKNNNGRIVTVTSAFVLDPKLAINVIEQDSSSFISTYPPMLEGWFKDYGRPLNPIDSVKLKIK